MKHDRHPFDAAAFDGNVYDLGPYLVAMPDRDPDDRHARDDDGDLHVDDDRLDAVALGKLTCAGFAIGLALAWLVDRLTGGPGLGVMLGW